MRKNPDIPRILKRLGSLLLIFVIMLASSGCDSSSRSGGGEFSVSGRATLDGGAGIPGVTMTFTRVSGTGIIPSSVTTDAGGDWSQSGFAVGTTYRATPSLAGHAFSPSFSDFSGASSSVDCMGTPTYSGSGRAALGGGAGIPGVTMTFTRVSGSGSIPSSVTTDASGDWSQSGFEDGSTYRATPTLAGYTFFPTSRDFSGASSSLDFTGLQVYSGSGRVALGSGTGIPGVTMTFTLVSGSGRIPSPVTTDASGDWSRSGFVVGATYRATPTLSGYTFSPTSLDFGSASSSLDFTGTLIPPATYSGSGRAALSGGAGIPGVTITFTLVSGSGSVPSSVITDASGDWSQSGFEDGSTYRVTPSLAGYTFAPTSTDFSAASSTLDFTGTLIPPATYSGSGRAALSGGAGIPGVTMIFSRVSGSGSIPSSTTTDGAGDWTQTGFEDGSTYRVIPSLAGYTFAPTSTDFSAASSTLDFTGTVSGIPGTIYVPDDYTTIQEAVDAAASGDTIIVRDGTYIGAGNRDIEFGNKSLTLQSENGADNCIIDCQSSGRGFYFYLTGTADIVVDGFTIINGSVSGNPSWLDNSGGGISCEQSSPTIKNCIIRDNYASANGGGIFSYSGAPAVVDCVISGNSTLGSGGGIRGVGAAFNIIGCDITTNAAGAGGGISLGVGALAPGYEFAVTNCLITANTATADGAGIQIQAASAGPFPAAVTNCTLTGNAAGTSGGGLSVNTGAAPVVTDSIFWNNTAPTSAEIVVLDNFHAAWLDIDYSDVAGGQAAIDVSAGSTLTYGADNIDLDPLFVAGPLGSHYLSQLSAGQASQSPCINAGSAGAMSFGLDNTWTRTDHVGDVSTVDIGYHYGVNYGPAVIVYVPDDYATIQAAVDAVGVGSTIIVRDGTYTGAGNKDITFGGRSLTLQSENGPAACIIDCENDGRGFYVDMTWNRNGAVTLDGFRIINGNRSGFPTWQENSGGGIYVYSGYPTISNCIISGNTAESFGGGIMNRYADSLITNCVITGNTSNNGGGIRSTYSEPTITDCVITDNDTTWGGGGISITVHVPGPAGGPHITNCLIAGNTADSGGGIYLSAIETGPNPAAITNCTITGNTAAADVGGLYISGDIVVTARDSILWDNTSPVTQEIYLRDVASWDSTLDIDYSDVAGGQAAIVVDPRATLTYGAGNIDADPLFATGPLGDYYLSQLLAGQGADSPCVDTGSDTAVNVGLDSLTTRTDDVADSGVVDMGYHY